MQYTYGTSNKAADRLYEISKFFNPLSINFIQNYYRNKFNTGIDIGCGPGFTTNMLANAIKSDNVYGLDISDNFLSLAKKNYSQYHFIKHDITKFPFPLSGEIEYARFELSHLKNPVLLINKWANELKNNGIIFIEEVEDVHTNTDVLNKYLEINKDLIANQGADLFVGKIIAPGKYEFKVLCNESVKIPVAEWQAATWFYPNTATIWKDDDYIKTKIIENERKRISDKILEIKRSEENKGNTFWVMRRIAILKN